MLVLDQITILFIKTFVSFTQKNIVEQSSFCSASTVLLRASQNSTITINPHNLAVTGSFELIDNVKYPLELHVKTNKCSPLTSKCTEYNYFKLPGFCTFFNQLPFQKGGLGDFIRPPVRCPLKRGNYDANVSLSLDQFGKLPLDSSVKYQVKIMMYELVPGQKKRMVFCTESYIPVTSSLSRGKSG